MKKELLVLAIETVIRGGSVSIYKDNQEVDTVAGEGNISRSEDLLQMIANLFQKNNLCLTNVDIISVATGPGSFTGIRIGIATAKGLSLALNCDIIGVSLLDALSFSFNELTEKVVVIPASREQIFCNLSWDQESKVLVGEPQELFSTLKKQNGKTIKIIAKTPLQSSFIEKLEKENYKFIYASDNGAKFIALYTIDYLSKNSEITKEIEPIYINERSIISNEP